MFLVSLSFSLFDKHFAPIDSLALFLVQLCQFHRKLCHVTAAVSQAVLQQWLYCSSTRRQTLLWIKQGTVQCIVLGIHNALQCMPQLFQGTSIPQKMSYIIKIITYTLNNVEIIPVILPLNKYNMAIKKQQPTKKQLMYLKLGLVVELYTYVHRRFACQRQ